MAGTLFTVEGFVKQFPRIFGNLSALIRSNTACRFYWTRQNLSFPSVLGKQSLHLTAPKSTGHSVQQLTQIKSYSRCVSVLVNFCVVDCDNGSNTNYVSAASLVGHTVLPLCPLCYTQVRYKSTNKHQDDSDDSDEDDVLEDDDFDAPPNFKVMKVHVASTRADAVASSAFDVARNRLEEVFLTSGLLLNGSRMSKKSVKMDTGDYLDLVVDKTDDELKVKRVKILRIYPDKTSKDKFILKVRVWKAPFLVAKPESGHIKRS